MYWFDILLLVLASARVTRLILVDSLGEWWLVKPAIVWATGRKSEKYIEGLLTCPFCIGFWICLAGVGSLMLAGGPGNAAVWWQVLAGTFSLSYIVGHVVAKIDY
jgi:hypothetical protein